METQPKNKKFKKRLIILSILISTILLSLLGCFYVLSRGITIEKINLASIEVRGFYLKLNNKLILTLDTLSIGKSRSSSPLKVPEVINLFQNSLIAISYFEKIELKKIIFPNKQEASIFYDGLRYELLFPQAKALFQIQQDPQKINLTIQQLSFDEFNFHLNGQIDYLITRNKIDFSLTASSNKAKTEQEKLIIKGQSDLKKLDISAFSTPFENLNLYEEEFQKVPELHEWLFKKASFKNIRIKNLFFSAPLNERFIPRMLKSLYAELDLEEVAVKFEPDLSPITAPALKIKFKNEVLRFDLDHPSYEGINLEGSFVELHNLAHPTSAIKTLLYLQSKEILLDQRIHQILQAYQIDFDITQSDRSPIDLNLKIALQEVEDHLKIEAHGIFKSQESHFNFFGMPVFAENLNVVLDLNEDKKHIFINDSMLELQEPVIKGLFNLDINLAQENLSGFFNPKLIEVSTQQANQEDQESSPLEEIFTLTQKEIPKLQIKADFSSTPTIEIPDFDLQISLGEEKEITLETIEKLYPYSPLLNYLAIKSGRASIKTKDFKDFDIQADLTNLSYPIFDQEWNLLDQLSVSIKVTPQQIYVHSLKDDLSLSYEDHLLKVSLKDKNFDLQSLKNSDIPAISIQAESSTKSLNPSFEEEKSSFMLYLESKNSIVKYKKLKLPTDEIIVNMKNKKITLDVTHKNGVANIDFYDDIIKFNANNFGGDFINLVAGKELVKGGLFGASGFYKNKKFRADFEIQNTIFQNFAALQNIVALIDTIPSLIVFKKPGLGVDGYQVKSGRVLIEVNEDYVGLKKIDLTGSTIDVSGGGIITLATQELNVSLTISTIKGLSEVLNKIPIVGYLLLGKEGKISTSLILKGTLQNPKPEVTLADDIISAPFKIIQRIFIPD